MTSYVLGFEEVDRTSVVLVGGKGAHLGELSRLAGVRVPDGFCVTTSAYQRLVAHAPAFDDLLGRLSRLTAADREAVSALSAELRKTLFELAVPLEIAAQIGQALAHYGERCAYAVRSSATAEDSPTASFAGQQDTYLNVIGTEAVLEHIRRCWASLFTERAVAYRLQNGFDHRKLLMAVVVQRMVFPDASGVLFTADPITGDRKVSSIEAVFGLGESLVSGHVDADGYKVRNGKVVVRTVRSKRMAVRASRAGGTEEQIVEPGRAEQPALSDAQVESLAQLGRRIETYLGGPQDIEWCLSDDEFYIVQSRPITTLFPVPAAPDGANRVYISVGHQQMMTDAMKPLGISMWLMTTRAPMREAGGRLFVDVTQQLASPSSRAALLAGFGKSDPLIRDALDTILGREEFPLPTPTEGPNASPVWAAPAPIEASPAVAVELISQAQASIEEAKRAIQTRSGPALFDFILADLQDLKRIAFDPRSLQLIMAAIHATWWLNDKLAEWLGEKNAADALVQSVPHNVTSEMGLALLDVADAVRPHAEVVRFLEGVAEDQDFLEELPRLAGGVEAKDAILRFLDTYGMRCVGEIDITRSRFRERPATLVPLILGNVRMFEHGESQRRFERGQQHARETEQSLLTRLLLLPDGEEKAKDTKERIDLVRALSGYREYPKYAMISRYFVYKEALLREADRLVQARVLREQEDLAFLTFHELHEVACSGHVDQELLRTRKEAFRWHQSLKPPRVLTSDGEVLHGAYRRADVPAGALVGLPVSAGTIEGRARVILDLASANLGTDDILVTAYTDPSWTPLFVGIKGLVTEVGGLMTHGAVIAREYGLPAVVGVQRATQLIRDGQRIRVNGTDGLVEVLP